jgi:SAM-dependent methyltransferase
VSHATFIVGDSLTVLRSLPDASVDLVLSSPPFLALRSYLPAGHPDKALEMGSEPTPGEFIDRLLDIVEECRRVLAPHGSLALELGDTYAGSGGAGGDYRPDGLRAGQPKFRAGTPRWDGRPDGQVRTTTWPESARGNSDTATYNRASGASGNGRLAVYGDERGNPDGMRDTTFSGANTRTGGGHGWPLDKSLTLVPEIFRFSLVYGFNPLTGWETPRWRVRNVVRWCRPNPPVGALADKVRPATSDIVIACTGRKRYFDLDAVRTVGSEPGAVKRHSIDHHNPSQGWGANNAEIKQNPAGAPPLDHWWHDDVFEQDTWLIPTEPYSGAHYATWPRDLCVKPIEMMCPRRVCTVCGKPSERIVEVSYVDANGKPAPGVSWGSGMVDGKGAHSLKTATRTTTTTTTGWTDCGHGGAWRNGVVLDPFCGSGTTLAVATGLGRDAIGIDLDSRNAELARARVGMFLDVVENEAAS